MITITVQGDTYDQCNEMLGLNKGHIQTATEAQLLAELRSRYRPFGFAVNIDPINEPPEEENPDAQNDKGPAEATETRETAQEPKKRGRPSKRAGANGPTGSSPDPEKSAEEPAQDVEVTEEQVIEALGAYAKKHNGSQAAARMAMKEVAGVERMKDLKKEDYPKVLAHLLATM